MNDNKHPYERRDDDRRLHSEDDEQLRGNTMNEAIREVHGDPDMDISHLNDETGQGGLGRNRDVYGADDTQGVGMNPNDASAVRSGGTVDMDDQTAGGAGLAGERLGTSNITTKHGVSGSDFDGQNATA